MDLTNHPCFNDKVRHTFGRIHLPVAPRCNIQCKFCNRKFDCVNESRPGVTSGVLSPYQAMVYLDEVLKQKKSISVVGIAGPGDPFANPNETIETLKGVRKKYPEMLLCIATNGLNIMPYIDQLAQINVSHVTVTINAVVPEIASKIYSWVRYGKRVYQADKGVKLLLENQIKAVKGLKDGGITVKVNSIIIPGINDEHIPEIAEKMADMNVDILNCIPYYPNSGAEFEYLKEPSKEMIDRVRKEAGKYIRQMHHCTRCRADAVGLLNEAPNPELMNMLQACEKIPLDSEDFRSFKNFGSLNRPYIAVASMEGVLVNQHLGEAYQLFIYGKKNGGAALIDTRKTPEPGSGIQRWNNLSEIISDCNTLLVSGIGSNPRKVLTEKGIRIFEMEGIIEDAVNGIFEGTNISHLIKRKRQACGTGCTGTGGGCG